MNGTQASVLRESLIAEALSIALGNNVTIRSTHSLYPPWYDNALILVSLEFFGSLLGKVMMVFNLSTANTIVEDLSGETSDREIREDCLKEIMNMTANYWVGAMGNQLHEGFQFRVPTYIEGGLSRNMLDPAQYTIAYEFSIGDPDLTGRLFIELRES